MVRVYCKTLDFDKEKPTSTEILFNGNSTPISEALGIAVDFTINDNHKLKEYTLNLYRLNTPASGILTGLGATTIDPDKFTLSDSIKVSSPSNGGRTMRLQKKCG